MAPKKKPYSQLCDSAKYFRDNPKARKKKDAISKKVNARPEQRAKRSELTTARRKRGIAGKGGGDLHHTKSGRLVRTSVKKNRGKADQGGRKRGKRGGRR